MSKQIRQTIWFPGKMPGRHGPTSAARRNPYLTARHKKQWTQFGYQTCLQEKLAWVRDCLFLFQWCEARRNRDPVNTATVRRYAFDDMVLVGVIEGDGWKNTSRGWVDRQVHLVGKRVRQDVGARVTIYGLPRRGEEGETCG